MEESRVFGPNEQIYAEGDAASHLFLIQQGSVTTHVSGEDISFGEGQIFGDGGLVTGKYKVTVKAGPQGCTIFPMHLDRLKAEIGRSPPIVRLFITNMLGRFEIMSELLKG
ncbi:MAG: cyclic nucleotide-binding domain-containing protein [Roseibium sp.]